MKNLYFIVLLLISLDSSAQYCDRGFEIGGGLEYPLYEQKYNPMLTFDLYIYCVGIGTDFGLLYNNERVEEFGIGRWIGTSFNFNLYTELDLTRFSPTLNRFLMNFGYKYAQQTLTRINDLKGKTNYFYVKTEFLVSRYFMLYNKIDLNVGSNRYVANSDVLVSFGLQFFINSKKRGFNNAPGY